MVKLCDVIRHPRFLDVACFVDTIHDDGTVGVNWVNMGYVQTWIMGKRSDIQIDNTWLRCKNPGIKCIRYGIWEPL